MFRRKAQLILALAVLMRAGAVFACPGDCNGDGWVTVDELTLAVDIHRDGARAGVCVGLDVDGGGVSTGEIVDAVGNALTGCPYVGQFYAMADLGGGKIGTVEISVSADGNASGTLTIAGGEGGGSGAVTLPMFSISGSVNLDTGAFSLSGSIDDGLGHVVPFSIGGTLPLPLGGGGTVSFHVGNDSFDGSIFPGPPPAPTPTPTATRTPGGGTVHVIEVGGSGGTVFFPEFIAINLGDTIEWHWTSGPHSVVASAHNGVGMATCDPSGALASDVMSSGTFSHTFDVAGDFDYHCGVPGHCEDFESAIIQVIGPTATTTPTPTKTPAPPTPTVTPATIDGVSIDMIGTFSGTATAQSTGFMFNAKVRIDAGSGSVTATDLDGTVFFFLGSLTMTVIDPTHLSYHRVDPSPEVMLTLNLTSPGHVDGVFNVIIPFMPSTPVNLSLTREP